jgi:signal transduction histidine kinase
MIDIMPTLALIELLLIIASLIATGSLVVAIISIRHAEKEKNASLSTIQTLQENLDTTKKVVTDYQERMKKTNSADSLTELLQSTTIAAITFNEKGNIVGLNPYAQKLSEYTTQEVMLRESSALFLPPKTSRDISPATVSAIFDQNATPQELQGQLLIKNKEPLSVTGTLIPYVIHGIRQAVYLFHDGNQDSKEALQGQLTALTAKLDVIKQEENLTKDIVSQIPIAIAIINASQEITFLNPLAQTLLGIGQNEGIGRNYKEYIRLIGSDGMPKFNAIDTALTGKTAPLLPWVFLLTRRGSMPIMGTVTPMSHNEALLAFADATDRYQKESDERAFFSGAAHDLRTPLTAIRGFLDLSIDGLGKLPQEKLHDMLNDAHASAIHLIGLVNDLLAVSRIDMGRTIVTREGFDIGLITSEIIATNKQLAKDRNLTLTHEIIEVNIPKILADKNKTKEIIQNLISNAIKYTAQGGVTVSHRVEGSRVITTVTDTGGGISPDNKHLLFRKFQQVGIARNQPLAKSTGLGLYISKTYATMMGGDLILEKSEPGKGSTFALSLPIFIEK